MEKSTKILITCGLLVCFLIIPIGVYVLAQTSTKPEEKSVLTRTPPARSNDELISAITSDPAYLENGGVPDIIIKEYLRPLPNWYVVTIQMKSDDTGNTAKVLVNDPVSDVSGIRVILGPGTSFSEQDISEHGVPSGVLEVLNR